MKKWKLGKITLFFQVSVMNVIFVFHPLQTRSFWKQKFLGRGSLSPPLTLSSEFLWTLPSDSSIDSWAVSIIQFVIHYHHSIFSWEKKHAVLLCVLFWHLILTNFLNFNSPFSSDIFQIFRIMLGKSIPLMDWFSWMTSWRTSNLSLLCVRPPNKKISVLNEINYAVLNQCHPSVILVLLKHRLVAGHLMMLVRLWSLISPVWYQIGDVPNLRAPGLPLTHHCLRRT